MRKKITYIIVFVALLISTFQPTMNVLAAEKTVTLSGLNFVPGKGWAVVFNITGKWKQGDLHGNTLSVGGKTYNLYCNFRDAAHISCTMESLAAYIGENATIYFAGQTFGAIVPDRPSGAGAGFAECPSNEFEQVFITGWDEAGVDYSGSYSYSADTYTIQEAAEEWVALMLFFNDIVIISYRITGVSCSLG
jgi:hypothetical protein